MLHTSQTVSFRQGFNEKREEEGIACLGWVNGGILRDIEKMEV